MIDIYYNHRGEIKMRLEDVRGKKLKASNGNIGRYARWQHTAKGIRIWLENEEKHVVGSILLKNVKKIKEWYKW